MIFANNVIFANGNAQFWRCFRPKIHPKIVIILLNKFGIPQVCFRPLEYIIRLPTKLLVKLRFGDFRIFLKFCSLIIISLPQKLPKNHHTSLEGVASTKFLLMFKIHVKVFDKIVSVLSYLWLVLTQPAFTCSKLTIETLEQRCEICLKLTIKCFYC